MREIHYPYAPAPSAVENWQLQFAGAISERAWQPASDLLRVNFHGFSKATGNSQFTWYLAAYLTEAPKWALVDSGLPPAIVNLGACRTQTIWEFMAAHLRSCQDAVSGGDLRQAHFHLRAALELRPRTQVHEGACMAVFTQLALFIGALEAPLAQAHVDLESDPARPAPHPDDSKAGIQGFYHADLLPDLLQRAKRAGVSQGFFELGVRAIAQHAHWPTWRSLASISNFQNAHLRKAARLVRAAESNLSSPAAAFLHAFGKGMRFQTLPSTATDDPAF